MTARIALAAALALAAPGAALGGSGTARLLVSATVVRSMQVSVGEEAGGSVALRVRTSGGEGWDAHVQSAADVPGVGLSRSAADRSYVVVTVLADGPAPADAVAPPRR